MNVNALRLLLERARDSQPLDVEGLHYRNPADFVLRHGCEYAVGKLMELRGDKRDSPEVVHGGGEVRDA